jgi:hypothetical protein
MSGDPLYSCAITTKIRRNNRHMRKLYKILWTWRGHRHLPLSGAACRRVTCPICERIQTRALFNAMDKYAWRKMLFITPNIAQNYQTPHSVPCRLLQPICTRIVPAGYSSIKQGKVARNPAVRREQYFTSRP